MCIYTCHWTWTLWLKTANSTGKGSSALLAIWPLRLSWSTASPFPSTSKTLYPEQGSFCFAQDHASLCQGRRVRIQILAFVALPSINRSSEYARKHSIDATGRPCSGTHCGACAIWPHHWVWSWGGWIEDRLVIPQIDCWRNHDDAVLLSWGIAWESHEHFRKWPCAWRRIWEVGHFLQCSCTLGPTLVQACKGHKDFKDQGWEGSVLHSIGNSDGPIPRPNHWLWTTSNGSGDSLWELERSLGAR